MDILKDKTVEDIQLLLNMREHFASFGALFHLVTGARRITPEHIEDRGLMNVKKRYKLCLLRLLSLGADVNVHDFFGNTLLHHCVGPNANEITSGPS